MSEFARFARQVGRALIVVLAVTAVVAVASSAGATASGQPPASLVDATAEDLDDTTDDLNDTTDEVSEGTDGLNDTVDGVAEATEDVERTTSVGETATGDDDTNGIHVTLEGAIEVEATDGGGLQVGLNGTLLETGTLSTVALAVSEESGDSSDDSGTDSSAGASPGGTEGTGSAADGPGPSDAVDAGLVGVLGGLALLGQGAAAGGGGAGGSAGAGSTALPGRFARHLPRLAGTLSSILGKLPLSMLRYSRYDDSDPLDHETRRDIFEAVESDPGLYLSALEGRQDASLSTIRHHLSVLEDEGLVETAKQNGKRRYYPAQAEDVELAAALDEPAKARVLSVLAETGDAHNGRIADALDLDPSTVSHHLSSLEDDGLIERRREGRTIVNSLAPAVESAYGSRADSVGGPGDDAPERVPTHSDD